MNILELTNINRYFGEGDSRVHVLKDITFTVERGDFVAIIGQSGSGKSTLMNIIGCLDKPTSGTYLVNGVDTEKLDGNALAEMRGKQFGFIFQRYNLMNSVTALENVELPAVYTGVAKSARKKRARSLLENLGLGEKTDSHPNQLSGGQQQRVSIARALMNGGEVILADEPTGALDSKSGENVMDILKQLNAEGHTVIMVTHDRGLAAQAHRRIEIKDGEIIGDERLQPLQSAEPRPAEKPQNAFLYQKDQVAEAFRMSVQAILAHKMRSMLTMLGIIIGIASVVTMIALGRGTQEQVLSNIAAMGTNTIDIMPGTGFRDRNSAKITTLTVADAKVLAEQSYIASASPNANSSGSVIYGNKSADGVTMNGVGMQYFDVKGLSIAAGRIFSEEEEASGAAVVVIDDNTKNEFFSNNENPVGKILFFDKRPMTVIGVTAKQTATMGPANLLRIYAPYTTVMNRVSGARSISSVTVKIDNDVNMQVAEKNLQTLLTARHNGVTDFFTMNSDSIKQTIESTTGTLTMLISGIALISLVVGGIGVMNIMLVSVTERTKEIGVRMAIGAKQWNVRLQFLIEAILICMIGGIIGVLLSYLLGYLASVFMPSTILSFSVDSVIMAMGCSTAIGVIFGFMPANSASKLNPVDALARE
ncbi:MAG: MacB family efflux pump subunit [Mailhella sp.]|nr:MacB family efflux pump subunit [Mailhella sp.]